MNKWFFLAFSLFCFCLSFFVPAGIGFILVPLSTGMVGYFIGISSAARSDRRRAGNQNAGRPANLR